MNRDLVIGTPAPLDGWSGVRALGVTAVVHLDRECSAVGGMVRENGMRYLRLPINRGGVPEAEELHIVTRWVEERIHDDGPVMVHDASIRGNDAVVACAVLIKQGRTVDSALARLRSIAEIPLTQAQVRLLHQFVAQRAVSAARA